MHTYTGTALCVGDHIDTDAIIPARFLTTTDTKELGMHCMEGLEHNWIQRVTPGKNILVAGRNFGCGSSREHAPIAIIGAEIPVVIAHSFARIFYRNAFNMGLLVLEIGDAVSNISEGDLLKTDVTQGIITNVSTGVIMHHPALPDTMRAILDAGGLAPYVRKTLSN